MKCTISSLLLIFLIVLAPPRCNADENTFTLQGTIRTIAGEPVADAEIYLYASGNTRRPADFISPKSARNGSYRMVLPRAPYWGVARVKKGERFGPLMPGDKHSGEPVKIEPDSDLSLNLDFTVADMQELAQRRGKERDELLEVSGAVSTDGRGIANVYVYARTGRMTATIPEFFSGWTDLDGKFRLKLPPGKFFLGCNRTFPPEEPNDTLQEITVETGKLPVAINLHLPVK